MTEEKDKIIKNLMNSINTLKAQNAELVNGSKDDIRVKTIKTLRDERASQENVIKLLRKYINNEQEVDKYLIKTFEKAGDDRIPTYEELAIKLKRLQSECTDLKLKMRTTKNDLVSKEELQEEVKKKLKDESMVVQTRIVELEQENEGLKEAKRNLEELHADLFEKLQTYNKEMGSMRSIYDVMKDNIRKEFEQKNRETLMEMDELRREKESLSTRIEEVLLFSNDKIAKIAEENELLKFQNNSFKNLLDGKQTEIDVLVDEIKNYKKVFENSDQRLGSETKKLKQQIEGQQMEIKELKDKLVSMQGLLKKRENTTIDYDEIITGKDREIEELREEVDLYLSKMEEMEKCQRDIEGF